VKVARRASSVAVAAAEKSKVSHVAEGGVIMEVSRIPGDGNKMNARSTWKDIMLELCDMIRTSVGIKVREIIHYAK